jgi:hypothetical protein
MELNPHSCRNARPVERRCLTAGKGRRTPGMLLKTNWRRAAAGR